MKTNDVAQWFINRAYVDFDENYGEPLTYNKMIALMYFAQGCHLACKNKLLFSGSIKVGNSILNIDAPFKEFYIGQEVWLNQLKVIEGMDEDTEQFLNNVYELFGREYTFIALNNQIKKHLKKYHLTNDTDDKNIIEKDKLKQCFLECVVKYE